MTDSPKLKPTPYGDTNFPDIRVQGYAYVDKTRFIEELERCGVRFPFLVRPRRFGKTLTTSMLRAYYDEAAADRFEQTFAGTYIGSHRTPLASAFRVLQLDFSGIASSASDHQTLVKSFQASVLASVRKYFQRYPQSNQDEVLANTFSNAADLIDSFFSLVYRGDGETFLYVIIDEYDQFANEVLAKDLHHFQAITSAEGFLKDFFSKLKAATTGTIARIFITGVTSISIDSMTSGFNIATNCTTFPAFADLFGFTEAELRDLVPQVLDIEQLGLWLDDLIARMKEWYNGYRFSPQNSATVFNPTM